MTGRHAECVRRERETSCQACQPIPWNPTRSLADRRRPARTRTATPRSSCKGRNVEIPDHFRIYVSEKLARLERFDRTIYLFDVELDHERNRRQRKNCQHVEITARGRGPVVRGEACADSFYAALRVRRPQTREPAAAQQGPPQDPLRRQDAGVAGRGHRDRRRCREALNGPTPTPHVDAATLSTTTSPASIVRTKEHPAKPMTVDDALYEMELVGHDFFLFHDKETDKPSRRLPPARLRLRADPARLSEPAEPDPARPDALCDGAARHVAYHGVGARSRPRSI